MAEKPITAIVLYNPLRSPLEIAVEKVIIAFCSIFVVLIILALLKTTIREHLKRLIGRE